MPSSTFKSFVYFCMFLSKIAEHKDESLMTSTNLSICIGPNIFVSPEEGALEILEESAYANKALEVMIRLVGDIFGDVKITEEDLCDATTTARILPGRPPIVPRRRGG